MENQNHIFDELRVIFSPERLDAYLGHTKCKNSKDNALLEYSRNIQLSQALYPSLQILEITLRNSLHKAITDYLQTEHWFELSFLHEKEQNRVNKAKTTLKEKRKTITPGRVVAELSFGFWVSLFDIRYEHSQTLWPQLIKPTFPFLPKGQKTRNFISRELNNIKSLRNRVFHYEPIWHWKDLLQHHDSIIFLTKCLSPAAAKYLITLDQFKMIHSNEKFKI